MVKFLEYMTYIKTKQHRMHGRTVAEGYAGAVMQKQRAIKQGRIYGHLSRVWVGRGHI